jgi:putative ABC transport system substrate-binding protein
MPDLTRLGVMGMAADPAYEVMSRQTNLEVGAVNITGIPLGTKEGDDFDALFVRAKKQGAQAIMVFSSYLKNLPVSAQLTELAIRHKLPIFSNATGAARDGGMIIGYQGDGFAMNSEVNGPRRAGYYVDRILKGAKPGDLPIEGPTNYTLVVNLKTAKAVGVTIPQSVLFQADEIIE